MVDRGRTACKENRVSYRLLWHSPALAEGRDLRTAMALPVTLSEGAGSSTVSSELLVSQVAMLVCCQQQVKGNQQR